MKTDIELKAEAFDEFLENTKDGDFRDRIANYTLKTIYSIKRVKAVVIEPHRIVMEKARDEFFETIPHDRGYVMEYTYKKTTESAYREIMKAHGDVFVVFGSYTSMDNGEASTEWGFKGASIPVVKSDVSWDFDIDQPSKRINEEFKYWLCVGSDNEPWD